MVSHLYYETIQGPDQTAVTWWFFGHCSPFPCPDTSPDSQPSPSCLQGACSQDRLQELSFIPAECIPLQLLLPPLPPDVPFSWAADSPSATGICLSVVKGSVSDVIGGYIRVPNSGRGNMRGRFQLTKQVLPTLPILNKCQSISFQVEKANNY